MWSRLTEYAGNVAEIVAPSDEMPGAEIGEELWSRFTNIVAPNDGTPGSGRGQKPTHSGETSATAVQDGTDLKEEDDDEQERYISELERALLQKKKQNELLEQRVRELEGGGTAGAIDAVDAAEAQEKDERLAALTAQVQELQKKLADAKRAKDEEVAVLRDHNAGLEKRVADLDMRIQVLNATMADREQNEPSSTNYEHGDDGVGVTVSTHQPSVFPTLVQAALLLSNGLAGSNVEVGTTEFVVATQIVELAENVRKELELSHATAKRLQTAVSSFLGMHGDSDEPISTIDHSEVQAKLGVLSHKISKGAADARDLERARRQVQDLTEREEKQQKTILALQTQLSGVQSSKLKNDQSLASRESEMMAVIQKKDIMISNLQANEEQMKQTLAHLGKDLETANADLDEAERLYRKQQDEILKLQKKCEDAASLRQEYNELQARARELQRSAQEYEQGYLGLLQEAEALKEKTEEEKAALVATTEAQVISTEKQIIYDLEARLSACEADKLVAVQDADRLQSEIDALDKVLLQFRSDHKLQKERVFSLEQALEDAKQTPSSPSAGRGGVSEDDFKRVMQVLQTRTLECEQLREALENSAKRFSSETEVLDKRLAAQLVVSYFESDKKHDVLLLISRMMGFTEEQKRRAGIMLDGQVVLPGNGGGGLFSSIFGISTPSSHIEADASSANSANDVASQDKSVGEMWTNFLLEEAKR